MVSGFGVRSVLPCALVMASGFGLGSASFVSGLEC